MSGLRIETTCPSPLSDVAAWQRAYSGAKIEVGCHANLKISSDVSGAAGNEWERYHCDAPESRRGSDGKSTGLAVIITLELELDVESGSRSRSTRAPARPSTLMMDSHWRRKAG